MNKRDVFISQIFETNEKKFEELAIDICKWQATENEIYKQYVDLLKINLEGINCLEKIPFLPIEFFKTNEIKTGKFTEEIIFKSSGTTGQMPSQHFVRDKNLYEKSFLQSFEMIFGKPSDFCILALLPSYLEREGSSLVNMTQKLIELSNHIDSGFYLHEFSVLEEKLFSLQKQKQKTILFGVSFALLDFADAIKEKFPELIIVETGGMKGRRKEILREELHRILKHKLGVEQIYAEYGMTELLSQAYSSSNGKFNTPPWMKIFIRDVNDPFNITSKSSSGALNIIDLANLDSCCFLATADAGKINADGSFEVLGRIENVEQRGCNLMIE